MRKFIIPLGLIVVLASSCVSKKKYAELEQQYKDTHGNLQKTTLQKEELEAKFAKIEKRVENYNQKINSLKNVNSGLKQENDIKLDMVGNTAVISNKTRERMRETLAKVDAADLAEAKTLKDSLNLAISYNLKNKMNTSDLNNSDDINIDIDQTVVMISVSDKLLFNTASYRVKKGAYSLVEKLANVINSEPSMDVMIEGHTDSRTINNASVQDNWDLSVIRSTSLVRELIKNGVDAKRIIASGRGEFFPISDNDNKDGRAKNRRSEIILSPKLDELYNLIKE